MIADHLRASSFLVADGVTPSNEGRGYVLRRIMRRAMRHAQMLGAAEPLMWRLVPALVEEMGHAYPELQRAESLISDTLLTEETRFRTTLARGLAILDEETASLAAGDRLPGETAFKLYDTYGFPLDLTEDALRPRGIGVEKEGFETAMARQRAEARKAWAGSGETATEAVWFALKERVGATEFLGYEAEKSEGVVTALLKDGVETFSLKKGDRGAVVLNQTPFYGELGGQVGDTGELKGPGLLFRVESTHKKLGDLIVHEGVLEEAGEAGLAEGATLVLEVDHTRRRATRANHSATHILHEALRRVLGDHVQQKGSLVAPDRLRFDFTHPKPMTPEEIAEVERLANEIVQDNASVETRLMAQEEAINSGARALFGEKYGDEVRVVAMGRREGTSGHAFSVELCGGTHVRRTGDIGLLSIVSQGAVASGVRRIEARTAEGARAELVAQSKALAEIAALMRAPAEEAPARLAELLGGAQAPGARAVRRQAQARHGRRRGGKPAGHRRRRDQALRARGQRRRFERSEGSRRRGEEVDRFWRRRDCEQLARRQGRRRRRRDRRSDGPLQRRRFCPPRRREARGQGRRRPSRSRAGGRPRRFRDRRGSGRDRRSVARQSGAVSRSRPLATTVAKLQQSPRKRHPCG